LAGAAEPHGPQRRSVELLEREDWCAQDSERQGRPDGTLDERVRETISEAADGSQTGAVRRHQQRGLEFSERCDGRLDDRLEHRPAEMEAADDGSDARLTSQKLRVSHDVDDPGVAAPGENYEPAVGEPHDDGLVVEDQ